MCKKYKPNNVYILEIHGCQYYVGCHTQSKEMSENKILRSSGNPLRKAKRKGLITHEEYKDCIKIVHIEEFDSADEAKNREVELIAEYKKKYGPLCLNRSAGNKSGQKGIKRSDSFKERVSNSLRNRLDQSKHILQFTLDGQFIAEYPSISEASRQTGTNLPHICQCCKGTRKSAGNSLWAYA